ncbi:MAG: hypothetical protein IPK78_11240 [Rhodospirillales bacterium]|nr:hypothetical protein [Rhodospirillales bacterium]
MSETKRTTTRSDASHALEVARAGGGGEGPIVVNFEPAKYRFEPDSSPKYQSTY